VVFSTGECAKCGRDVWRLAWPIAADYAEFVCLYCGVIRFLPATAELLKFLRGDE